MSSVTRRDRRVHAAGVAGTSCALPISACPADADRTEISLSAGNLSGTSAGGGSNAAVSLAPAPGVHSSRRIFLTFSRWSFFCCSVSFSALEFDSLRWSEGSRNLKHSRRSECETTAEEKLKELHKIEIYEVKSASRCRFLEIVPLHRVRHHFTVYWIE